ncbi:MAG: hypothetical protein QXX83_10380 [Thermofilum sp.]
MEIDKRGLLEFMRANEGKLRNFLGCDYDEVYKAVQNGPRPKLYGKLDLLLEGKGERVYVEEKNLATLSANKLHVLKELIIDLYLNLVRGCKSGPALQQLWQRRVLQQDHLHLARLRRGVLGPLRHTRTLGGKLHP